MGFPRQEYWSGLPFLSPGNLPRPGIKPESSALAGSFSFLFFTTEPPGKLAPGITELDKQEKTFEPERVRPLLLMVSSE